MTLSSRVAAAVAAGSAAEIFRSRRRCGFVNGKFVKKRLVGSRRGRGRAESGTKASSSSSSSSFTVTDFEDDDEEEEGYFSGKTACAYDEEATKCLVTACFAERCRNEWEKQKEENGGDATATFEHTVDFGLSKSEIRIDDAHVEIRRKDDENAIVLNREDVFDVEPDDLTVYKVVRPWTSDEKAPSPLVLEPCRVYSSTGGIMY